MTKYIINAKKLVQLVQVEVDAEDVNEAKDLYLQMAHSGGVDISDMEWAQLSHGDLDVEVQ